MSLSTIIITGSQIVSIPVTISSMDAPANIVDVVIDVANNAELISNPAIVKGDKFSNWSIALEPIIENDQIKFSLFTLVEADRYQGGTTLLVSLSLGTQAVSNQQIVPLNINTLGGPRTKIKTKIGSDPTVDAVLTTNNGTITLTSSNSFAVFLPLIVKGF